MRPTTLTRTVRLSIVAAGLALAAAACADQGTDPTAANTIPPAATTPATTPPTDGSAVPLPAPPPATATDATTATAPTTQPAPRPVGLHFDTPQQAMRYLAAAYNRGDAAALKKVTNATARAALLEMRQEAVNLRLDSCSRRASGDYVCQFHHDYPARQPRRGLGHATFLAAPVANRGWYMTVLISCG